MNQSDKLDAIEALLLNNPCESHCDHEDHSADPADCDCCLACCIAWILYPEE